MSVPYDAEIAHKSETVSSQEVEALNKRPEPSQRRFRQRRRKRPARKAGLFVGLLVDLGSHEADDDHDTKKTCNNGENGAVETSHVILLAFGTSFQK